MKRKKKKKEINIFTLSINALKRAGKIDTKDMEDSRSYRKKGWIHK